MSTPLFDHVEAQARKTRGMSLAAEKRNPLLGRVQAVAVEVARRKGCITADDVTFEMLRLDPHYRPEALGNAAGSIFKGKRWQWTGEVLPAIRVESHGRLLRVWRLRAA